MKTLNPQTLPDVPQVRSFNDADTALLELGKIESDLQKKEAELNLSIQSLREKFDSDTTQNRARKEQLEKQVEQFCISNKFEFEKSRSKELLHGIVGFRNATPKVQLLNRKYKIDTVLELLARVRFGKDFIRTKEEIAKDKILTAYSAKEIDDAKLASVGLKIDQEENFFHEINWESIPE